MKTLVAIAALAQVAVAGQAHVSVLSCGDTYYGAYKPRVPVAIEEIEPVARGRLLAHLKARLGADLAARTTLVGGQIVDRQALRRDNPNSVHYEWHVPKYDLKFRVPLSAHAICVSLKMDEDGTLLEDVALPDFAKHPERRNVISEVDAMKIARAKGMPSEATRELAYFPDVDSLEWTFTFFVSQRGPDIRLKSLHLPAHDPSKAHWAEVRAIQ